MSRNNQSGNIRLKVQPEREDGITIQKNLNQFQNSFQSQLCIPATLNAKDIWYYDHYPVYPCYYFRVAFFLCLVPFWVDITDQRNVKLLTYKVQRGLCAIVHICSFLSQIVWFRFIAIQSIKEHPDKVFWMTRLVFNSICVLAYAKVVWSRRIVDLLEKIPPKRTRNVIWKGSVSCKVL